MQIQGEASEAVTTFSWVGAELLTVFQVLFFLVLGYVSLRVWLSLRPGNKRAPAKKIDDINEDAEGAPDTQQVAEGSLPSRSKVRSRNFNAAERKRQRKESKRLEPESPAAALHPGCPSVEEVQEPDAPVAEPVEEPVEVVQDGTTAKDGVSKSMMKKAERKARMKALKTRMEAEQGLEESVTLPAINQKADSETSSQDGQTSQTASTPSTISTAASDATLTMTEQSDCGTPDSARSKTDADDAPTLQIEVAVSPQNKKGKKKQQKTPVNAVQEDCLPPAKNSEAIPAVVTSKAPCDETPPTTAEIAEAGIVPKVVSASNNNAELESYEESFDSAQQQQPVDEVPTEQNESVRHDDQKVVECLDSAHPICEVTMNRDNLETESDMESNADSPEHPLEKSPQATDMASTPVLWCGMPEDPTLQIEGWVAVAVPAECAPPGAFDGLWMNKGEEKILIEKLDIMFESGETWNMEMHSLTNISVEVEGEQFCGELDTSGDVAVLKWSDGDVWTFYGKVGDSPEVPPQVVPEIPCMMPPFMMPESMPVVEMTLCNQCLPPDAEKWEICWDWKKKGWCPRGSNCEWYHPVVDAPFF